MKTTFTILSLLALTIGVNAQTISTIEEGVLTPNSYYDGSDYSGGFTSGNAFFDNYYDTTWGASFGYWASGWAYSNIGDTVTQPSSYTQLYNAKEISGYALSPNFAVGTQGSRIVLNGTATGKVVNGFYITNSTYAFNSMKLGDSFAKKFGGTSGNDPDYFKVVVKSYLGGTLSADSVDFFLADFRFSDNSQDYIVKNWTWVDLSTLGNVDSLEFTLRSTDVGSFGINTPLYYCIDNFTTADSPVSIADQTKDVNLQVYPNPFNEFIRIENSKNPAVSIKDIHGRNMAVILTNSIIDTRTLVQGVYFVEVDGEIKKLIKQ